MKRMFIFVAVCAMVLSGCTNEENSMTLEERAEIRAAESRAYIDDLAARVGTDPEVRQDEILGCVPGRDDSGLNPTYTVHVTVSKGAVERLRGEIADHFEAQGWTVKRDPIYPGDDEVSVRFAKGPFNMGARISESINWASVGGSGGCVE